MVRLFGFLLTGEIRGGGSGGIRGGRGKRGRMVRGDGGSDAGRGTRERRNGRGGGGRVLKQKLLPDVRQLWFVAFSYRNVEAYSLIMS